jgi:hypothetical protein
MKIKEQEDAINARKRLLPAEGEPAHVRGQGADHGDLIGITTNTAGMDIAHTGVAVRMQNGANSTSCTPPLPARKCRSPNSRCT